MASGTSRSASRIQGWTGQGIRREQWLGYLFIAPMFIFLLGIVFFPLVSAFMTSFYREAGVNVRFVGLANYTRLLNDPQFWNSLRVSVIFTVASVVLHLVVAMPVALFLNWVRKGRTVVRLAFLTPWMIAPVFGATVWLWLLDPHFGVVNYLLQAGGLIGQAKVWLGEPVPALMSVIIVDVWRGFPFVMLILLAGLQSVPQEQYEAAAIDGAGTIGRFFYITLPHLRYLLVVATTLDVINTIRTFDIVNILTRGGPVNATEVLPVLIYNTAFQANRFGPAAAIGVVLLLLLLVFSFFYILVLQPEQATEGTV